MTPRRKSIRFSTRVASSAGLGAFWALGYFTFGAWAQTARTFDPSISLDASIPFVGWAIWPYLFGFVWIALPAGAIRSPELFRRTAVAYALVITLSFLCFVLVPAEAISLRDHASTNGLDRLTAWAVYTLHTFDPPTNLLPSLHVSLATVATFALARQYPAWQAPAFGLLMMVIVSVCISKQHTIVDAVAGLIVALAAFNLSGRLKGLQRAAAAH